MRLIEIRVPASDAELVADRCWGLGAAGIWEVEATGGVTVLRLGVDPEHAHGLLDALAAWGPVDVTDELAVVLATRTVVVDVGGHALELSVPPTVFGDGRHPTTTACLSLMCDLVRPGTAVLDVGCGSGVLSVAAASLGASVTAIDIEPAAVDATTANAATLGLEVDASVTPLSEIAHRFDVVVANISAGGLIDLADELCAHTTSGGALVLSGVLADRWEDVYAAMGGAQVLARIEDAGWVTVALEAS